MTNANRIRQMSDAELKDFIVDVIQDRIGFNFCGSKKCPYVGECDRYGSCIHPDEWAEVTYWLSEETGV